jgi:hypothetical protein
MAAYHNARARMNKVNGEKHHMTFSSTESRGVALEMNLREYGCGKFSDCHSHMVGHVSPVESASRILKETIGSGYFDLS